MCRFLDRMRRHGGQPRSADGRLAELRMKSDRMEGGSLSSLPIPTRARSSVAYGPLRLRGCPRRSSALCAWQGRA